MRRLPASGHGRVNERVSRLAALLVLVAAAAIPARAGEFRLFLEGEAGVRNDGDYSQGSQGSQGDRLVQTRDQAVGRAGLNLQLSYHRERLDLAMGYSPSYERGFDHPEQLSGLTHRLDFGLVGDLSRRLKLSVREQLFSSPTRDLYAPTQADTNVANVAPRQGDQLVHSLNVQLDDAVTRRVSIRAGVSQGMRMYRDSGLADSRELLGRLGASVELDRGRQAEVAADAGRYDYGALGEASVRTFGVAWATGLGKSSRLRLEAGGYSVDSTRRARPLPGQPGEPALESSSDQGWRGGLQFARDQRLFHWALGLSHDVSPGAGLGRAAKADNAFLGISTTSIGRRLTLALDVNGSRQRDVSSQLAAVGTIGTNHQLGTDGVLTEYAAGTASASWSFWQGFRAVGGYSRVWQRSRVEPFPNLSYGRYFLNLAFRIFNTGETPQLPERLGEPTHEEPDAQ